VVFLHPIIVDSNRPSQWLCIHWHWPLSVWSKHPSTTLPHELTLPREN